MEDRGPFDRVLQSEPLQQRDRAAAVIVVLGVVLGVILLVLVMPPVSIFSGDDDNGSPDTITGQIQDGMPAPPEGFEAVSPLVELAKAQIEQLTDPKLFKAVPKKKAQAKKS